MPMSAATRVERIETGREASISVATFSHPARDAHILPDLLERLRTAAPDYLPDRYRVDLLEEGYKLQRGRVKPLTEASVAELRKALGTATPGNAWLTRSSPPVVSFGIGTLFNTHLAYQPFSLFVERQAVSTNTQVQRFLDVSHTFLVSFNAFFGDLGTAPLMVTPAGPMGTQFVPVNLEKGLPPPKWGFLLGPEYVRLLGASRLKHAPCEVVRELDDGCVLLLMATNFRVLEDDRNLLESRRQRLVSHLGTEFFSYLEGPEPKRVLPQFSPQRRGNAKEPDGGG